VGVLLTSNISSCANISLKSRCRKSKNAKLAGFKALVIVNTDDIIFPPGGEESTDLIPTVMIGHSFWEYYQSTCAALFVCPEMTTLLVFGNPPILN
jgi:hypothetical protein